MDFPIRETIEKRRSVRTYETRPLSREDRERLTSYAARIENPFGVPVRIDLIETERSEQPKKLGTYGVIKGAGSFLGIAAPQDKLGLEAAGYAMEKLVLYATHLGLGTCWLAGTLNREGFTRAMHTGEDEWMPAITPVGYAAEKPSFHEQLMRSTMKSARRKPWKELFFRADFKTPLTEADTGAYAEPLELLRLAPSATNAQPWRVVMDGQFFHFYAVVGKEALAANPPAIQRVDGGIGACHFHLSAQDKGLRGAFERLEGRSADAPEGWRYLFSWVKA